MAKNVPLQEVIAPPPSALLSSLNSSVLSPPRLVDFFGGILKNIVHPSLIEPKKPTDIVLLTTGFYALCSVGIGFTKAHSIYRAALLPPITYTAYLIGQYSFDIMPRVLLSNIIAGTVCAAWTQFVVSAFILQENFDDAGPKPGASATYPPKKNPATDPKPTSPKVSPSEDTPYLNPIALGLGTSSQYSRHRPDTPIHRLLFGLNTVNSQRNVLTPQRARDIPPFSSKDPTWVPTRSQFLLSRGLVALSSLLIIDVLTSTPSDPSSNPTTFAQYKASLYRPLSELWGEEFKTRAQASIGQWVGLYFVMTWVHSSIAWVTVLTGFYTPEAWPPLFGSVLEIWSLRQWWGRFWHSMLRYKLSAAADWVTYGALGLGRGGLAARYAHLFAVFGASGICHIMMDVVGPIRWWESRGMQFFLMHAVGITIEDGVQWCWRKVRGRTRKQDDGIPRWWVRMLGFGWVVGYQVWVTPMWVYPGLRAAVRITGEKGQFLPWSFVNWAKALIA